MLSLKNSLFLVNIYDFHKISHKWHSYVSQLICYLLLMQRSKNTAIVFLKADLQSSQLLYLRQQFSKRLAQELELELQVVMHEVVTTVEVLLISQILVNTITRGKTCTLRVPTRSYLPISFCLTYS